MDEDIKNFLLNFNSYFGQMDFLGDLKKITKKEDFENYLLGNNLVIQASDIKPIPQSYLLANFTDLYKYIDKQSSIIYVNFLFWLDKKFVKFSETDHHIVRLYFPNCRVQKNIVEMHNMTRSAEYVQGKKSLSYWLYRDGSPREKKYETKPVVCIEINKQNSKDFDKGNEGCFYVKIVDKQVVSPRAGRFPKSWFNEKSKDELKAFTEYINWLVSFSDESFYYYSFPSVFPYKEGFFGFYIASRSKLTKEQLSNFKITSNYIGSVFQFIISKLISQAAFKALKKSAVAAIMSRNMSHNLGSHILFYLKMIFSDTPNLFEKHIHELEKNDGELVLKVLKNHENEIKITGRPAEEITAPFLTGVGRFLSYLQERQDFIATIASDFIPYFGSVSFKDFIYDEINPDLRIRRHDAADKYKVKNILLDFIAKSEDYTRDDIEVYFKNFDGRDRESLDLEILRTINVDLPGGILGRQAFFSIFENFIRNTAKHSDKSKIHKLKIVIDVDKMNDGTNFYRVRLYDKNKNGLKDLKIIENALKDKYIDDTGNLLLSNKGIKEMRISAAWLRGLSVADIDEEKIEPKVLKIIKVDDNGIEIDNKTIEGNLCYEFYLPVSKKWVFVTSRGNDVGIGKNELTIKSYEDFINEDTNYKLVLLDETLSDEQKSRIEYISPTRCIPISQNDLKKQGNNFINIYNKFWLAKKFKGFIRSDNKYFLIIDNKVKGKYNIESVPKQLLVKGDDREAIEEIDELGEKLIVFRKHNDVPEHFDELKRDELKKVYDQAIFIEGISGHNSTNRLLRNEILNQEWLLKMTESALTKILIIDERIFNILSGNEFPRINFTISDLVRSTDSVEKLNNFFKEKEINIVSTDIKRLYDNLCGIIKSKNQLDISEYNQTIFLRCQTLLEKIENLNSDEPNEKGRFNKELYGKKNISVFNIKKDLRNGGYFVITDIDGKTMGIIHKNKEENLIWNLNIKVNYDFVVIHQGILDKLYDYADVTNNDERQSIFDQFRDNFNVRFKYIIHSGRSRPEFLPKKVAFNQFSSIEVALFDCKYSLTEQLYAARYE